jgi:hypothetical protein
MKPCFLLLAVARTAVSAPPPAGDPVADSALVSAYVAANVNATFRNASGALRYPYQVPGGPYDQLWDWDSIFVGVSAAKLGGSPFFLGSMLNFMAAVNLTDGEVPGCLTPSGASPTLYHAKPILIQGAFLAAKANGGDFAAFKPFGPAMLALLSYWERPPRLDAATGLHAWHDQLETGADNLVFSSCPSAYSPDCWAESEAFTLSSPDIEVFLAREHEAYALFLQAWAGVDWEAEAESHRAVVASITTAINTFLWDNNRGYYGGYNLSSGQRIPSRTFQAAWPAWGKLANASQIAASFAQLAMPDLSSPFGLRSTSSSDPRFTNANMINPYSNWRGPVWINVAIVMAYTLADLGGEYYRAGLNAGVTLLHTLAEDLRNTGQWHECYSSADGSGLAAPGFLSWNTLGADLLDNLLAGTNPFALAL